VLCSRSAACYAIRTPAITTMQEATSEARTFSSVMQVVGAFAHGVVYWSRGGPPDHGRSGGQAHVARRPNPPTLASFRSPRPEADYHQLALPYRTFKFRYDNSTPYSIPQEV
jgi:hypothetical protein